MTPLQDADQRIAVAQAAVAADPDSIEAACRLDLAQRYRAWVVAHPDAQPGATPAGD